MKNDISYEYKRRVLKYIEENHLINDKDTVVVGLSGGADSVCLLRMLADIKNEINFSIVAVHVHHGIRGVTADRDEEFSRKLCDEMLIPYEAFYIDVPKEAKRSKESVEECARRLRYDIFRNVAKEHDNALIAVAHHIDDQAETILFRMIRGTGIKGLSGMLPKNENIIRPLLCISKEDIINYLVANKYSYINDETNADASYSRNRIRINILPEAEEICEKAKEHIAAISQEASEMALLIEKLGKELEERALIKKYSETESEFDVLLFKEAENVILNSALRNIVKNHIHSLKDITRDHIEDIKKLLEGGEARFINLPKNLCVKREGNILRFTVLKANNEKLKDESEDFMVYIEDLKSVILPDGKELVIEKDCDIDTACIPQKIYTKWLDYDKISPGLCLRYRREKDFLVVDSKGSKKSIKRYMIDEKIPQSMRDKILVLASDSHVFWILGYRISEDAKVSENTKHIVRFEIKGD